MFEIIVLLAAFGVLAFNRASLVVYSLAIVIVLTLLTYFATTYLLLSFLWIAAAAILVPLNSKSLRKKWLTNKVFAKFKQITPEMSSTEKEALEAGTVSFEGEIFSGAPDFQTLLNTPAILLTAEEQAFLDGPVRQLNRMLDEWDITHNLSDLPAEAWAFIKDNGFLGMIIPKRYGGLEFSATAQSAVLVSIYNRSISAATTISVPNSLGPGELLLKYGTKEQKEYYLPRLAKGKEIPCFALTSPNAGSDAASIPDSGIVCFDKFNGQEVLGVRLNWDKRYITLCPVATVIGLAFQMFDPDGLLGTKKNIGITCALIPAETKGVVAGRRHFPLNTAFMNGPTQGKDVFIPMDYLIGGEAMAGCGWRMLMECLSAGRAISLPSTAVGGGQGAALTSGAYARVRKQFNTSISNFEGVQEALARIAGYLYISDAGLTVTAAAVDGGAKPAVASAIMKYHTTEYSRKISLDAMDVHGGKGICLGPNNYLGRGYQNAPISITVEGANILTRCLIIFGQGAIRCHPYVLEELESVSTDDIKRFDNAFFAHAGFFISNVVRSLVLGVTDGRLTYNKSGKIKRPLQLIGRYSATLAFLADFSMMLFGGDLKRKERMSGRLGDLLSNLYLASCVLKRFHDNGRPSEEWPLVQWSCQHLFFECESKVFELINNMPHRWARIMLRGILFPLGRRRHAPSDKLGQKVAELLTTDNETRNRLTRYVFTEVLDNNPIGDVEDAFKQLLAVEELERKVCQLGKKGELSGLTLLDWIVSAEQQTLISSEEAKRLLQAEKARQTVIAVDDFAHEELAHVKKAVAKNNAKQKTAAKTS